MPRDLRLRRATEFRRVFAAPKRFGGDGFLVLARAGAGSRARLGLAISKRCARRAVDRNWLKRIARESFRIKATDLPKVDVVVLCTRDWRQLNPQRLRSSLEEVWDRIRTKTWDES